MSEAVVDEIFNTFARHGGESYGEGVTQLEHALQSAELARLDGAPDALIAAALLHDIGQFIDGAGDAAERHDSDGRHEELGSALLSRHYGAAVTEPIRLHVAAKRYLVTTRAGYLDELSSASRLSLSLQGGAMSADEVSAFEAHPFFADAVRMRGYDDGGKRGDWVVPALDSYRPLLDSLVHPSLVSSPA